MNILKKIPWIIPVLLFNNSCTDSNPNIQENTTINTASVASSDSIQNIENLKKIKLFSESYLPDTISPKGMWNIPDSIITAFKALRNDKPSQEKYLTLLFLKIYRGHLHCCHQSFEVRKNVFKNNKKILGIDSISDPLLYEYNLITKQFDSDKGIEMISSGLAHSWVEKNNRLLNFSNIDIEYKHITKLQNQIQSIDY